MNIINKFAIILTALVAIFTIPLLLFTKFDNEQSQENVHVKSALTTASYDAIQTITLTDGLAFGTQKQKDEVLDVFYTSLSAGYYSVLGVNNYTLNAYLPFVMLIDNNGAYVCYDLNYSSYWGSGASKPENADDTYYITPISSYSATYTLGGDYPEYVVQFTLGDNATIYSDGRIIAQGSYSHIKNLLDTKYPNAIESMPFLFSEDMFVSEKQSVVTSIISNLINKYLNEDVQGGDYVGFNIANAQYYFELPTEQQEWQNIISAPTVISFYHGPQARINHHSIAQVVLAGGELAKSTYYYVTVDSDGNKWYHTSDCEHIDTSTQVTTFSSMEEAAKTGAYPDPDCIY